MPFQKKVHSLWLMVNGFKNHSNRPPTTNHRPRTNLGFTLIELLIVIALIAITSGIVSSAFISSQKKGRDAQRKSDLQAVKKALEAAKNNCLGSSYYPSNDPPGQNGLLNYSSFLASYLSDPDLNYLSVAIQDPASSKSYYYHKPSSATSNVCHDINGTPNLQYGVKTYLLRAKLEITKDPSTNTSRTNCQNSISQITSWSPPTPSTDDGYYYECPD